MPLIQLEGPIRGLYFLRFPLALWAMLLAITVLDTEAPAAIFRGILTSETFPQAASTAFLIFSTGCIILLLIRVIAINGQERFERNEWLFNTFGGGHFGIGPDRGRALPRYAFPFAHAPGLILICRVYHDSTAENGLVPSQAILYLLTGVFLAYLFWLVVGLVYYWSFDAQGIPNSPHELIFPRWLIPLTGNAAQQIHQSAKPLIADWLDTLIFKYFARIGPGYSNDRQILYEGHRLTFIAFAGLTLLYIFLFNFTAPVPIPYAELACNTVTLIALALFLSGCILLSQQGFQNPAGGAITFCAARVVQTIVVVLLIATIILVIVLWLNHTRAERGFSVLGSVLILVTGIFWLLTTIAFFADRSRIPVLSVSLGLILVLKCIPAYRAEHFFTVSIQDTPLPAALTPSEILDNRLQAPGVPPSRPLIIITAQGGGIHAAAWTANVLAELEKQFAKADADPKHAFHSRILLASGVSGGSVGLLPFLREYTAPTPFQDPKASANRIVQEATCSSLQAVAWGLTYNDMLNFLSIVPNLPVASGIAPKGKPANGVDRSWALERSLNRNLSDPACKYDSEYLASGNKQLQDGYQLTLASTAKGLREGKIPAFTFNTTAAETGGRFLLSNYQLPETVMPDSPLATDLLPAESFLHAFSHVQTASPGPRAFADQPLAAAARMSGTFSFVSSAARIPTAVAPKGADHFIDGGYYDNDGTASAMEFLYFAQTGSKILKDRKNLHAPPIPILLIEIRNGPDLPATESLDSYHQQDTYRTRWGAVNQLLAPVMGLYTAGNGSQTLRDRHELCILETAQKDDFLIHHVIFDYRNQNDSPQPLSWHLTPNQQDTIACAIDPTTTYCAAKKIKDIEKDKSSTKTIHTLAFEAAQWHPTPQELYREPCENTGLGPQNSETPRK